MMADVAAIQNSWQHHGRVLACENCGGEGREYRSRYGGNDPDVWDAGQCPVCSGSGNQPCQQCDDGVAVATWMLRGKRCLICQSCHDEWLENE